MIRFLVNRYYALPACLRDALTGLLYALMIAAVFLLSEADDVGFRYLEL